jgi:predicted secreted Zn-dependent protease
MLFSEAFHELSELYKKQYEQSSLLSGRASDPSVMQMQEALTALELQTLSLYNRLQEKFPDELHQCINTLINDLQRVYYKLTAYETHEQARYPFSKSLCIKAMKDLANLRDSRQTTYARCWVFEITRQVLEEFREEQVQ